MGHPTMRLYLPIFLWAPAILLVVHSCKIHDSGVQHKQQKFIVNKHNALRKLLAQNKVPGQPKAIDMKRLRYDAKLAELAQAVANTCNYTHQKVNDSRWTVLGQNLAKLDSTSKPKSPKWNKVIVNWFKEYKLYQFSNDTIKGTGHYTQIVWAETGYIGCGYVEYNNGTDSWYHQFYVCQYGKGGNIRGVYPYKVGNGHECDNLC